MPVRVSPHSIFLRLQQPPLPLHAPTISRQRAIFPHHTMTRHHYRHRIRPDRRTDRSRSLRHTQLQRQLRITPRLSPRNRLQRLPHPLLKRRSPYIQRKRRSQRMLSQLTSHKRNRFREPTRISLSRDQLSLGKLLPQPSHQLLIIAPKRNRADPDIRRRNQHPSQRTGRRRITNQQSRSTLPHHTRRHPQRRRALLIQPSARPKPRLIDRISNRSLSCLRLAHFIFEPLQSRLLRILPRTHPQHPLEPAQNRQPSYPSSLRRLGQRRGREEAHLLPRRPPARTTRLAVNLRRLHRIYKLAIRTRIPFQHLLPLLPGKITRDNHRAVTCLHCTSHRHSSILPRHPLRPHSVSFLQTRMTVSA